MHVGKINEAELELQIDLDLLLLVLGKPVPFVDADYKRATSTYDVAEEAEILLGHGLPCVNHEDCHVAVVNCPEGLDDGELLDDLGYLLSLADSGGIDDYVLLSAALHRYVYGIPCGSDHRRRRGFPRGSC